jgi:hypothetical protein
MRPSRGRPRPPAAYCRRADRRGPRGRTRHRRRLSAAFSASGHADRRCGRPWLLRNHHRRETSVEDDKDVQGMAGEHMAYTFCVQTVLRIDGKTLRPAAGQGASANERPVGRPGRRATTRAASYSVTAHEQARQWIAR